jgi:hypothetical protein|tara:strand:+ start:122 stop:517 length:396 start_codon:yes stop_codon:yes gene_type:complete
MRPPTVFLIAVSAAAAVLCLARQGWTHDCVVTDWAIARNVQASAPIDRGQRFNIADRRVYTYVRLSCTRVEGPASFRFERNGHPHATVKLSLQPSTRWRTWASVRALPGNWRVVLEIEGHKLLDDTFAVSP